MNIGKFFGIGLKYQLSKVGKGRPELSREAFLNDLEAKGYQRETIASFYDAMVEYLPEVDDFSIYPEDDVIKDYCILDDDIGYILIKLFKKKGKKFPSRDQQGKFYDQYGEGATIEKLIQFMAHFYALEEE